MIETMLYKHLFEQLHTLFVRRLQYIPLVVGSVKFPVFVVARIVIGQKIDLLYTDVVLLQEINDLVHEFFVGIDSLNGWDADVDGSFIRAHFLQVL